MGNSRMEWAAELWIVEQLKYRMLRFTCVFVEVKHSEVFLPSVEDGTKAQHFLFYFFFCLPLCSFFYGRSSLYNRCFKVISLTAQLHQQLDCLSEYQKED